jgi:hypothetical protein
MTPHHQARLQVLIDGGKTELQALAHMLVDAEKNVLWNFAKSTEELSVANAELLLILTALAKKLGSTTGMMRTP